MVVEQHVEDVPQAKQQDPVACSIYEVLPLFTDARRDSVVARWRRRMLIAEVERLCAE